MCTTDALHCDDTAAAVDVLEHLRREEAVLHARRARALDELARANTAHQHRLVTGIDDPPERAEFADRSTRAQVACALRVSEVTAGRLVREAQALCGDLPGTLAALEAGVLSYRHAAAVVENAESLPPDTVPRFEEAVLAGRADVPAGRFAARVRRVRERMHPTSIDERATVAEAHRQVRVEPARDGMAWLSAYLPAVHAEAVHACLSTTAAFHRGSGDPRTLDQLRADALVHAVLRGAQGVDPARSLSERSESKRTASGEAVAARSLSERSETKRTPTTASGDAVAARSLSERSESKRTITTPAPAPAIPASADAVRELRVSVSITVPALTLLGQGDEPAVLDGYGPIPLETAKVLAAGATSWHRVLTHPVTGIRLTLDRTTYTVPAALREWLILRDRTCRFPGCSRTATGCDVDHTQAWDDGGCTDADNLAHLCRKHHRLKHHTRWRYEHLDNQTIVWTSPTGHTYRSHPPDG